MAWAGVVDPSIAPTDPLEAVGLDPQTNGLAVSSCWNQPGPNATNKKIVYGTVTVGGGAPNKLYTDEYSPQPGPGPFPAVVIVHGGGWVGWRRPQTTSIFRACPLPCSSATGPTRSSAYQAAADYRDKLQGHVTLQWCPVTGTLLGTQLLAPGVKCDGSTTDVFDQTVGFFKAHL